MKNTEAKIVDAVLQEPTTIVIGEKTFRMPALTMATLLRASKEIAKIPVQKDGIKDTLGDVFFNANYVKSISLAIATLIQGSKPKDIKVFGITIWKDKSIEALAKYILENIDIIKAHKVLVDIVKTLEVGFFLDIITTLNEINLTRKTRETEMTQSGQ